MKNFPHTEGLGHRERYFNTIINMHDEKYWGLKVETNNFDNKMRINLKGQCFNMDFDDNKVSFSKHESNPEANQSKLSSNSMYRINKILPQ